MSKLYSRTATFFCAVRRRTRHGRTNLALFALFESKSALLGKQRQCVDCRWRGCALQQGLTQNMALAANLTDHLFPVEPLVEETGTLYNQHILAEKRNLTWCETYFVGERELIERLESYISPRFVRPKHFVLHISEQGRSATRGTGARSKNGLLTVWISVRSACKTVQSMIAAAVPTMLACTLSKL